jgi:hypothetical protein
MKTLVIHPKDTTTDFLSVIYEDKIGWTIINDPKISKSKLKQQIKEHDRIVMLGHGTEIGLVIFDKREIRFIVDSTLVYLLRTKECVCIWCNADKFVEKYKLKGLYSGMIISEIDESYLYSVRTSIDDIEKSNILFASVISKYIDNKDIDMIKSEYYNEKCEVIKFNNKNIFIR